MGRFWCIYHGEEHDEADRSKEHIVPYAAGGSDQLVTWDTCHEANNALGSSADGPMINSFFFAAARWSHGVASADGRIPPIEFRGSVEIEGEKVPATYMIKPDRSVELSVSPRVASDWDKHTFRVACDPKDLPRILGDLQAKGRKKGMALDLSAANASEKHIVRVENPSMETGFSLGVYALHGGFLKMALAFTHHCLGEDWSLGEVADSIRTVLWDESPDKWSTAPIHGSIWPQEQSSGLERIVNLGNDKHILLIMNNNPLAFYGMLFGKFSGLVNLYDGVWTSGGVPVGGSVGVVMDVRTRAVEQITLEDIVAKRFMEWNQE